MAVSPSKPKPGGPSSRSGTGSAWRYRAKGVSISLIGVLAVVGLVSLFNMIVDRQLRRLPSTAQPYTRLDFTATRRHSLSDRTRATLARVNEPTQIVTLVPGDDPVAERLTDLIEAYALQNPKLQTRHLDPVTESDQVDQTLEQLAARYADELDPVRAAVAEALEQAQLMQGRLETLTALTGEAVDAWSNTQDPDRAALVPIQARFAQLLEAITQTIVEAETKMDRPLPEATDALRSLAALTDQAIQRLVLDARTINRLGDRLRREPAAWEAVLAMETPLRSALIEAQALRAAVVREPVPWRYRQARESITFAGGVVMLSPTGAAVVGLDRLMQARAVDSAEAQAQQIFVGEDVLTGALAGLTRSVKPRVVFVPGNTGPALPKRGGDGVGLMTDAARRLEALNVEVMQWSPLPDWDGPAYEPPPDDRPVVWVFLPLAQPDPDKPTTTDPKTRLAHGRWLQEVRAAGQPALVLLNHDPTAPADGDAMDPRARPILTALQSLGLSIDLTRRAAYLASDAQGVSVPKDVFELRGLTGEHPIAKAVSGLGLRFQRPSAITIQPTDGVTASPLVSLHEPQQWLFDRTGYTDRGTLVTPDQDGMLETITLGALVEDRLGRLAVFTEPVWALDTFTTLGRHPEAGTGVGRGTMPGGTPAYPGNGELLLNTLLWLMNEDALIQTGTQNQRLRLIEPSLADAKASVVYGLYFAAVALPVMLGLGVALSRRRRP